MITYFTQQEFSTLGAYNLGGTNATGQVPVMAGTSTIRLPSNDYFWDLQPIFGPSPTR